MLQLVYATARGYGTGVARPLEPPAQTLQWPPGTHFSRDAASPTRVVFDRNFQPMQQPPYSSIGLRLLNTGHDTFHLSLFCFLSLW